MYITV